MSTRDRRSERGRRLARRMLLAIGDDLREARLQAGLRQADVSPVAGISVAELSRIERSQSPHVAYETLAAIGAALGLDVTIRGFPNGDRIRDAAQLELLGRLRAILPAGLRCRYEVPLGIPGDLRAWDAMIDGVDWSVPADAETRLRDIQALQRRTAIKLRDSGHSTLLLVVADTRHNRQVVRQAADALTESFPLRGSVALAALAAGARPIGSAIILL